MVNKRQSTNMKLRASATIAAFMQFGAYGLALAGEGVIGPVYIERVSAVAISTGGHAAGNFEVQLKSSFPPVPGVVCDGTYITTLKSVDSDKRMFILAPWRRSRSSPCT